MNQYVITIIDLLETNNPSDRLTLLKNIEECLFFIENNTFQSTDELTSLEKKLLSTLYVFYDQHKTLFDYDNQFTCINDLCFIIVAYLRINRVMDTLMFDKIPEFKYFKIPETWSHNVQHTQSLSMRALYDMVELFTWKIFNDVHPQEERSENYIQESYQWLQQLINRSFVLLTMKDGDPSILDCKEYVISSIVKTDNDKNSICFNSKESVDEFEEYFNTFKMKLANQNKEKDEVEKVCCNLSFLSEISTMIIALHREYIFYFQIRHRFVEDEIDLRKLRHYLYENMKKLETGDISARFLSYVHKHSIDDSDNRMFKLKYPFDKAVSALTVLLRKRYNEYKDDFYPDNLKMLFKEREYLRIASDCCFSIENIQNKDFAFEDQIINRNWYHHPEIDNGPIIIYLFIVKKYAVVTSWDDNIPITTCNSFLEAFGVMRKIMRESNMSPEIRLKCDDKVTLSDMTFDVSIYDAYLF